MFARFDENPAMTLQDIKETKRYGRTHGWTDGCTDNVKTVYPPQTKFSGGININMNKNYSYPTTIWESILTQIYVFLVLFTIFTFDLEKCISKNWKN